MTTSIISKVNNSVIIKAVESAQGVRLGAEARRSVAIPPLGTPGAAPSLRSTSSALRRKALGAQALALGMLGSQVRIWPSKADGGRDGPMWSKRFYFAWPDCGLETN